MATDVTKLGSFQGHSSIVMRERKSLEPFHSVVSDHNVIYIYQAKNRKSGVNRKQVFHSPISTGMRESDALEIRKGDISPCCVHMTKPSKICAL